MSIEPKSLNENNSRYGNKSNRQAWQASLTLLSRLQDLYESGSYHSVIEKAIDVLKISINSIADLSNMDEANLARFYFLGKSYLATGQTDNAIACFHIVYSQSGFEEFMLKSPIKFSSLVAFAGDELEKIAKEKGDDYVNNSQVEQFMSKVLVKTGGCFIATAVYDSPMAVEVEVLRQFRDETLLQSKAGQIFVAIYYRISPPLAHAISKYRTIKIIMRNYILEPIVRVLISRYRRLTSLE
jgi:hypothetical protein